MTRTKQRIVFGCSILLATAIFFATRSVPAWNGSISDRRSNNHASSRPQLPATDRGKRAEPMLKAALNGKKVISVDEQTLIREWTDKVESSLKEVELSNTTLVSDKTYPETSIGNKKLPANRQIMLRVSAPSTEQVDDAYAKVSEAIKAVAVNRAAQEQMSTKLHKTIATYFTYPMKVKAINVILNGDEDRVIELSEHYVDDESLVFRPDGTFNFPSNTIRRFDSNFGGPDSWASKRYGHLVQVDSEKGTK